MEPDWNDDSPVGEFQDAGAARLPRASDSAELKPSPFRPAVVPEPESDAISQGMLELEPIARGRFDKSTPTVVDGEDLDVPTFLRRKR